MKTVFGEVFTKISNGIFIGIIGCILNGWGLYEKSDTMMLISIGILVGGFILAVINEERVIRKIEKLESSKKRNQKRFDYTMEELINTQDAVMYLKEDVSQLRDELKLKSSTIDRFKKIEVSMLRNGKLWKNLKEED
jgi:hypothetical protein